MKSARFWDDYTGVGGLLLLWWFDLVISASGYDIVTSISLADKATLIRFANNAGV